MILVVEDKVALPMLEVLERAGFDVVLAEDGETAWQILTSTSIALFLIDWNLPGLSGVGLVWKIRRLPQYGQTPIVMISGRASRQDIDKAMQAGVTEYLPKPLTVLQLRDTVRRMLQASPAGPVLEPRTIAGRDVSQPGAAPEAGPLEARVLLVEDTVGAAMSKVLGRFGIDVILAEDAEAAWQALVETPIDLFLIDWMLPHLSGLDLVRKIRQLPRYAGTPIVMISGRSSRADIEAAMAAGVTEYMAKPFTAVQLKHRVQGLLRAAPDGQEIQVQRLCRDQDSLDGASASPLVIFVDAISQARDLSRPEHRAAATFLLRAVGGIQAFNAAHPDLHLGYHLASHVGDAMNRLRRLTVRRRAKLVLVSLHARGNAFLLVPLLKDQRREPIPVVLVCDSLDAVPLEQISLIERMHVELYERHELDHDKLLTVLEDQILRS